MCLLLSPIVFDFSAQVPKAPEWSAAVAPRKRPHVSSGRSPDHLLAPTAFVPPGFGAGTGPCIRKASVWTTPRTIDDHL